MDAAAKQQVVERLKSAQNILVTVSTNPSVDQLAACIGVTLLFNKMGKHATAVFSGTVPSTIEFLQPDKTIEPNTDSLRDFIISLDKEKADKLRYKVEDQVVKIFITPYHTSLSENDLVFSQGDFNVEVVLALGVKSKDEVDKAITAHGRILHDATVVSVNAGEVKTPDIGQIHWQEPAASSLSEMLVSISEAFGANLIDGQMATAFLTGIVSETKRFSNQKTSPKVMTMSAQLMAAGANQQLIVSKLEPVVPVLPKQAAIKGQKPAEPQYAPDGTLKINHAGVGQKPGEEAESSEIHIDNEGNIVKPDDENEPGVAKPVQLPPAPTQPAPPLEAAPKEVTPPAQPESKDEPEPKKDGENLTGGHNLLNATSSGPLMGAAFTANTEPEWNLASQMDSLDPLSEPTAPGATGLLGHAPTVQPPATTLDKPAPSAAPQIVGPDAPTPEAPAPADNVGEARNAVESAYAAAPFDPALAPVAALNATPLAEVHPPEDTTTDQSDDIAPPAPPPVPPPLMPTPGVVIPAAPYPPANGSKTT
jgi:hypothetical protein